MKYFFHFIVFYSFLLCAVFDSAHLFAQENIGDLNKASNEASLTSLQRRSLAQSFVSRLKSSFTRADSYLYRFGVDNSKNILPEGSALLFEAVVGEKLRAEGLILGRAYNGKVLLSLRDVSDILQIPILIDAENKTVQGWYVREDKEFSLDLNSKIAKTDLGEFNVSDNFVIEGDDILVAAEELGVWMGFDFDPDISVQELHITSDNLLPMQERYLRRQKLAIREVMPEPSLPLGGEDYQSAAVPIINVATNSTYRKGGGDDDVGNTRHSTTIGSSGDFGYGMLRTQLQVNNTEQLKSVRLNYSQDSVDGELLGVLKARHFEVGDVITTRVPLGGSVGQEIGVRVTNTDPMRNFSTPSTGISGTAFPNWDVELYRDNHLVGLREIGEDGFYSFDNVNLFRSNNNFKLVFYGPQGELREESIFIPVDRNSLVRGEGVYDVSVSLERENTYNKNVGGGGDPDKGSLNLSALYEMPIVDGTSVSAGIRSSQFDGVRNSVVNIGTSTTLLQTLVNGGVAVDDEGELSANLTMRHDFDEHEFSDSLSWQDAGFDTQSSGGQGDVGVFKNSFNITGPLPFKIGARPRYNFNVNYSADTEDDYSVETNLGLNGAIKGISINEQIRYRTGSQLDDALEIDTNISGSYGAHRLRGSARYEVMPESELKTLLATYRRDINDKLEFEAGLNRRFESSITEYSAKLDWQAGVIRLSPSITYNSEQDFFAGLNTRFGILRDPSRGKVNVYDYTITNSGGASAFVYLDKDGDGLFNGEDEPLDGVVVNAPQNGGRIITDANGIALFSRMTKLRLTDVFVDPDSLQDPTWVTGFDGISIVPREGYVAEINFPVHISGEMDGSVYIRSVPLPVDGEMPVEARPVSLRNVQLKLYNDEGRVEQSVFTDAGGFYYFASIPPGRYFLIIDEKSASRGKFIRPEPQQIEIAYDGTVLYGNDIYVDTGGEDIPSVFLSDLDDYKARHPHIDFSDTNYDLVLNLGEFNSRLLMSVVWYKLRSRYNEILDEGELFVAPKDSYADVKSGKHILRVGLQNKTVANAYERCRALMARELYCKVEIYPSYMKHAEVGVHVD